MTTARAELYEDFSGKLCERLMEKYQLIAEHAHSVTQTVIDTMREEFAKQQIYFPSEDSHQRFNRDCAMWTEYQKTGSDPASIAKRNKISIQCFYRRMELIHDVMYSRKQPKLFD